MNCSRLIALLVACHVSVWVGCGGDGPTVIQPGNYELTAQEVANAKQFETMRGTQDESTPSAKQKRFSR